MLAGLKIQRPLFNSRCAHEYGDVGKQVDPSRLERDVDSRAGSSPVIPTINNYTPPSRQRVSCTTQFRNMWKAEATVTKFQVGYMNVLVGEIQEVKSNRFREEP